MGHGVGAPRARVVAIVQARMSSTRRPGKVLAQLGEHNVLELLLRRLAGATELDGVAVATSTDPSDDAIERETRRLGVLAVRGSLHDVLSRYVQGSLAARADAVVRITADCPLTDPAVVDDVVRQWRATGVDYVANSLEPRSYPDGFDVEVIATAALRRADEEARSAYDREHVTTYIRGHLDAFSSAEVRLEPALGDLRATLDTEDDLHLLRQLVDRLGPDARMREVINALGHDAPPEAHHTP